MPAIYELIKDYDSPDIVVPMAPMWVLAVVRWTHPFVFDRTRLGGSPIPEFIARRIDGFEQLQDAQIITSDCIQIDVSSSKASHVSNLSATLSAGTVNYLSSVYADDWLVAWFLPNETRAQNLISRIRAGQACNRFNDGLKFVGRVQTIFKDVAVDDAGKPSSNYTLTGVGFGEFDYPLFWEPLFAVNESLPVWYQRVGIAFNRIVTGKDQSISVTNDPNVIDVNKMIPSLVRLCLGEGPFKNGNLSVPGAGNASYNGGIRVPGLIGKLLGKADVESLNYSDVVDIVMGVQKFQGAAGAEQNSPSLFKPDGLAAATVPLAADATSSNDFSTLDLGLASVAEYQETGIPLLGGFPIVQLPFQDTPIWQILGQFQNEGMNEMFVSLKPDQDGNIYPRLTVRQYPFNSKKYESTVINTENPPVTTFLELPRWLVDPKMLKRIQVGRSNTLHSNFWHLQGTGPGTAINPIIQYVDHPPVTDKDDIERSGLRRVFKTVNCILSKGPRGVKAWQDMLADMTAGQHLALTGTIVMSGVVSPISVGDNIQFANVVYHIETVNHSGVISPDGRRQFRTTCQISHGMADEVTLEQNQADTELDTTLQEYAGVRNADHTSIRIGRSVLDRFQDE